MVFLSKRLSKRLCFSFIVFSLVFFSFGARSCSALSSLSMPAMDSTGKGILTTTSARLVADSSGVFLDTTPFSSVETQQSAETAAKLAARKAGASLEGNALLYSVHAPAEIIDGPSGGVAFALLAYAEFSGKTLRSDLAATGSIEQDGSVGKVGGVAEKLEAVHEAGLKIFLIPLGQGVQTGVDLRRLGEQWGMQVIEVANFDEAIAIAFTPTGSQAIAPKHETKPLVLAAIDALPASQSMRFLAENEIKALAADEAELSKKNDNSSALVASALRDALNSSRELLAKNYFYSAANAAFVARVAANSFFTANYSKQEFADAVRELAEETNASFEQNVDSSPMRVSSWEMLVGARLRYAWAAAKAAELEENAPLASKPLPFVEDYASALAWLEASRSMAAAASANASGVELNEFNARSEANALITKANASLSSSYDADAEWHLGVAEDSFSQGSYAAAAFDACFALGFSQARAKAEKTFGEEDFAALLGNASALRGFKSMWAQLYYAHSLYNIAEANRTADFAYSLNALELQELARCLESESARLKDAMSSPFAPEGSASVSVSAGGSPSPSEKGAALSIIYSVEPNGDSARLYFVFAFVVLVILVIISVLFVRARLREREPPLTDEERSRRLDDLLLRGRISEATYGRLRAKYSAAGKAALKPPKKRK